MVRPQRQLLRLSLRLPACLAVAVGVSACGGDESGSARRIAESLRSLPGVADVDDDYRSTFTHGETFDLTVHLQPSATVDQARQVAQTYFTGVRDVEFADGASVTLAIDAAKGTLTLRPRAVPAEQADAAVGLLFDVMASPAVEETWVARPGSELTVWLRQPVDTPAVAALRRSIPQLRDAVWGLRNAPAESFQPASTNTSPGVVPDALTQQAWTEVVHLASPEVVIGNYRPDVPPGAPATTFEIRDLPLGDGRMGAGNLADTAAQIAAALSRLDRPVEVTIGDDVHRRIEFTIDGCYAHTENHRPSPTETKLALLYERC